MAFAVLLCYAGALGLTATGGFAPAHPQRVSPCRRGPPSAFMSLDAPGSDGQGEEADDGEMDSGSPGDADVADAKRFLGLDAPADRDIETYLKRGKTLLGRRVAFLLGDDDKAMADIALFTATKLVKLGASVSLICSVPELCVELSTRVPYPRCTVLPTETRLLPSLEPSWRARRWSDAEPLAPLSRGSPAPRAPPF